MKKQIIYIKDIEEDDAYSIEEEEFMDKKPEQYKDLYQEREEEKFPFLYKKEQEMSPEQKEREKVDFYWAMRASKLTVDTL